MADPNNISQTLSLSKTFEVPQPELPRGRDRVTQLQISGDVTKMTLAGDALDEIISSDEEEEKQEEDLPPGMFSTAISRTD